MPTADEYFPATQALHTDWPSEYAQKPAAHAVQAEFAAAGKHTKPLQLANQPPPKHLVGRARVQPELGWLSLRTTGLLALGLPKRMRLQIEMQEIVGVTRAKPLRLRGVSRSARFYETSPWRATRRGSRPC